MVNGFIATYRYLIMFHCWNENKNSRPRFLDLLQMLNHMYKTNLGCMNLNLFNKNKYSYDDLRNEVRDFSWQQMKCPICDMKWENDDTMVTKRI